MSGDTEGSGDIVVGGSIYDNQTIKLCGIMKEVTQRYTKSGNRLITFMLEDKSGNIKCTAFNSCIEAN